VCPFLLIPCLDDRLKMATLLDDACLFVEYEMRGPEDGRKALKERNRVIQVMAEIAQATAQHPRHWSFLFTSRVGSREGA
jgi:hypothetical protein